MKRSGPPERKAPLKRGRPPARSTNPIRRLTRLRSRSRKRAAIAGERRAFVDRVIAARPTCEAGIVLAAKGPILAAIRCRTWSVDVHEIKPRGRGGPIVPSQGLDDRDVLACCRWCHDWITTNPDPAAELGFVVHSWEKRPSEG